MGNNDSYFFIVTFPTVALQPKLACPPFTNYYHPTHVIMTNCDRLMQLWVAYAPCGSQHKDAVQVTLEQIDLIKRFVAQYPDHMRFANDSAALLEAHAVGRVASLISVESGHSIGTSLAVLRMFHRLY